ncbi:hypothetical protein JOE34_001665 [Pseudomonas sp. PvP028]|nr:hypothetical protein [Pseudomonas sp. PvP028]
MGCYLGLRHGQLSRTSSLLRPAARSWGSRFASAAGRESVFREQVRSYGLRPEAEGSRPASAVGRECFSRTSSLLRPAARSWGSRSASAVGRESVFREQVRSYGLRPEAGDHGLLLPQGVSVFREQVRSYGLRPEAGDHGLLLPQGVRVFFANKFAPTACGQKLGITVCFCRRA